MKVYNRVSDVDLRVCIIDVYIYVLYMWVCIDVYLDHAN